MFMCQYMYIYIYYIFQQILYMLYYLRKFCLQTIRPLCPPRWFPGSSRGFGARPSQRSLRSNVRFSRVMACTPGPLEFKAFWAQNRALAAVWRTCVLLTMVFIDWIGPWRSPAQKSALLFTLFACTFRKRLKTQSQNLNCALRLTLLSFSLRFCIASRTYCKTGAKITIVSRKRYTLHTVSIHKRYFENHFRKTLLAGTRVQSVRAECTLSEDL